jgi:ferric-dicitrate binding protein FerR (iron transport regulator)
MNNETIYNLLILESKAELSPEERTELDSYRKTNGQEVASVEQIIRLSSDLVFLSDEDVNDSWRKFESSIKSETATVEPMPSPRRRMSRILLGLAASVLFVAVAYVFLQPKQHVFAAKTNQVEQTLSDGSQLLIGPASSVALNSTFGESSRELDVSGEIYIEAAKNAVPMNVRSDQFNIQVLGTRFNVMDFADDEISTVTLYEGRIKLTVSNGELYSLAAGDHICYDKSSRKVSRSTVSSERPSWLEGKLTFENSLFSEVFTKIERTYNVGFSGKDLLQDLHFTDQVGDQDLAALLTRIETATGHDIKSKGNASYQITAKN